MKTVKVAVKREQVLEHIKIEQPDFREPPDIIMPESFTLELPVEQVEIPRPTKGFPSICPGEHEFEEIELGGIGKIKRCHICGTAGEVKREDKRKRYKVHTEYYGCVVFDEDIIELEEVE